MTVYQTYTWTDLFIMLLGRRLVGFDGGSMQHDTASDNRYKPVNRVARTIMEGYATS